MRARALALAVLAAALTPSGAGAEEWSRARINRLPDSAFAAIEIGPDRKKVRHLPHHDETGAVDPAHLKAARARLPQVKWLDPANEAIARRHLDEHAREPSRRSAASARNLPACFADTGHAPPVLGCAPGRHLCTE
jgi:hypothetical protein